MPLPMLLTVYLTACGGHAADMRTLAEWRIWTSQGLVACGRLGGAAASSFELLSELHSTAKLSFRRISARAIQASWYVLLQMYRKSGGSAR